ncbi:hypothetical protein TNCV_3102861 [Trichonephila clavipes]|nr:hypothetical protein TNCV_3102861 [Trichonephila clavipes]
MACYEFEPSTTKDPPCRGTVVSDYCLAVDSLGVGDVPTHRVIGALSEHVESYFRNNKKPPYSFTIDGALCSGYRSNMEYRDSRAVLTVNCSTKEILHNSALVFEGTLETPSGWLLYTSLWA